MRKLAIATLVCLTLPAQASFFLNPYYSSSDTNFKNGQDVKTTIYGLEGGNDTFTLGFSNRNYSFQHSKNIDNLKSLYGNIHHGDALGDDGWSYFLYLGASLNWEDDFHPTENYNISPNAALTYHYDDELSLTLGAGGVINEYNSKAYPIVQVNFSNPKSDGLSFVLGFPKNTATYRFNQYFAINGELALNCDPAYQLKDNSVYVRKGYIEERSASAEGSLVVTPADQFSAKIGVGYTFDRDIRFYDHDGRKISKARLDNDWNFFVKGSLFF